MTHAKAGIESRDWITSSEFATLIGCTKGRVPQLVTEGKVGCVKGPAGDLRFDPLLVCRFLLERVEEKPATRGDFAVRAFALFEEGASLHECVRALNVGPDKVRALYDEWRTPLGGKVHDERERERDERKAHEDRMRYLDEEDRKQREEDARAHEARLRELARERKKR